MGYDKAPWHFKGKALYQLSLVKIDEARKYVPPELPLVNFFGWTLGGFYLARYSDSPVGAFDELVAMAGLAWNFPTSCAWAARVYVNNKEARDHGIRSVGLPSRLASFKALPLPSFSSAAPARSAPSGRAADATPCSNPNSKWERGAGTQPSTRSSARANRQSITSGSGSGGDDGRGTVVDRALARLQTTGRSWWDDPPVPQAAATDVDARGSRRSSRHRRHQRSMAAGGAAGDGDGGETQGTWALELGNEEPHRRRRGALGRVLPSWVRVPGVGKGVPGRGLAGGPVCRIELPAQPKGRGPLIRMCLPSFSGATPDFPGFLQYNLQLRANIRPVPTARLTFPPSRPAEESRNPEVLDLVLGGRPLLCLEFGNMEMEVQAPVPWRPKPA